MAGPVAVAIVILTVAGTEAKGVKFGAPVTPTSWRLKAGLY